MQKVLVVDDDAHIRDVVCFALRRSGYRPLTATDGRSALETVARELPALVVLDILMPELDGAEVCRRLRASSDVPIIFLTSKDEEMDRILGLELGADDYVVKPFSTSELVARLRAVIRRARPAVNAEILRFGDLALDLSAHRVSRAGQPIHLGPTEFRLLRFFLERPGRVFSREQLLDGVWGRDIYIDERTVDVHVGRLRRALNRGRASDPIRTVRGAGYSFDERFGRAAS